MAQLTTQEVTVSAESVYQEAYSDPAKMQYVFAYRIRITNNSAVPVTLLARAWEVIDATGERKLVEGEGVVGEQPEIMPGQYHEYTSWVQFETPMGAMQGSYSMRRNNSRGREEFFPVQVPKFLHLAPEILN
ncbi:MAG: ApaG protein [Neolewinella sp.]|jgi:ApaG protein